MSPRNFNHVIFTLVSRWKHAEYLCVGYGAETGVGGWGWGGVGVTNYVKIINNLCVFDASKPLTMSQKIIIIFNYVNVNYVMLTMHIVILSFDASRPPYSSRASVLTLHHRLSLRPHSHYPDIHSAHTTGTICRL